MREPTLIVLAVVPRQIPSGREMAAILELKAVLQRFFDWGSKYFLQHAE
jgi:hypothetical protein